MPFGAIFNSFFSEPRALKNNSANKITNTLVAYAKSKVIDIRRLRFH